MDTTPPTLTAFDLPNVIDLSLGNVNATILASASDDLSGIDRVQIYFDGDIRYGAVGGGGFISNDLFQMYGIGDSWSDGSSSLTWTYSEFNNPGMYTVSQVRVLDVSGNSRTYSTDDLIDLGFDTTIELRATADDTTPPTLTAFDLPNVIDLSLGDVNATILASASDDLSGIDRVQIYFDGDIRYGAVGGGGFISNDLFQMYGIGDSWSDGSSSLTWTYSEFNNPGMYTPAIFAEPVAGGCLMAGRRA